MPNVFLNTSDFETAQKLRKMGYKEVKMNNGIFSFINDKKLSQFSNEIDKSKLIYSNKMAF